MHSSSQELLVDPKDPKNAMLVETLVNLALLNGDVLLKVDMTYQITVPDKPNPISIRLTNDILIRLKEKMGKDDQYHLEPHCYVLGPITKGRGAQNVGVPDILGTLVVNKNTESKGLVYISDESKKKNRLVKIKRYKPSSQFLEKYETKHLKELKTIIERRLSILQAYIPFHAKSIISHKLNQGEIESYTKMKKFKGKLLSEILSDVNSPLSTQNRIQLSIALLQELKILHNLGITHCDIKPDNIIVHFDAETGLVAVRFIDFDSAKIANYQGDGGYTPEYASPELIIDSRHFKEIEAKTRKPMVDAKSDIWQMGLVLAEVWGGTHRNSNWFRNLNDKELLTDKAMPDLNDELEIFRDIKGINIVDVKFNNEFTGSLYAKMDIKKEEVNYNIIFDTIQNMVNVDKNKRIDVDKSMDNFEDIRFKYLYPVSLSASLEETKIIALEAERAALEFRNITIENQIKSEKFSPDKRSIMDEIILTNLERINEINKMLNSHSLNPLIRAIYHVNHFAKQFRHNDLFHINLSPNEVMNLKENGFALLVYNINEIMENDKEENKSILTHELKETLRLTSFNTCQQLEEMNETSKNILQELLNLKYQHLNLLFKVKMILQLLERLSDSTKNQLIRLPFTTERKSEYINPLITMNTLLNKINVLYNERSYSHLNTLDDIKEFNAELDQKLNALQNCFDILNNRCRELLKKEESKEKTNIILISDTGPGYFIRYENVLKKLSIVHPETPMDELKNFIKVGIFEYLDEVTKTNIIKPNRLANLETITEMLTNDKTTDTKKFIDTIQNYLDRMERRSIGPSPLQTKIEFAISKFLHQPYKDFAQDVPFIYQASSFKKSI